MTEKNLKTMKDIEVSFMEKEFRNEQRNVILIAATMILLIIIFPSTLELILLIFIPIVVAEYCLRNMPFFKRSILHETILDHIRSLNHTRDPYSHPLFIDGTCAIIEDLIQRKQRIHKKK